MNKGGTGDPTDNFMSSVCKSQLCDSRICHEKKLGVCGWAGREGQKTEEQLDTGVPGGLSGTTGNPM